MTFKQITVDHLNEALKSVAMHDDGKYSIVDVFNKAQELAEANAQQETYISADEARKLGAGAEWLGATGTWYRCLEGCSYIDTWNSTVVKYRAIKPQAQPEPEEPHAALRAEYDKQVAEGTTGFYLWEKCTDGDWYHGSIHFNFFCNEQYRCTDISCYVSKDDEPAIRMLRTEAQAFQRELGDTVEWSWVSSSGCAHPIYTIGSSVFRFSDESIYTYRAKHAKVVKWTGSRDDVIALLKELELLK